MSEEGYWTQVDAWAPWERYQNDTSPFFQVKPEMREEEKRPVDGLLGKPVE